MIERKVELLAPAGNYTCFVAALNAGADAIYIGGSRYGARAYADNFSEEEIVKAIRLAHLLNRKVYLTVNTLVKNSELDQLVAYMIPYYEAGLDGVIIQDMGVFEVIKRHFSGMELHASTQMTLTGMYGAQFLKEQGASRIVPARELSLEEIRYIKENVDIEIEAFIHGAMCYAYSGQCLFSSILGGRSGNRGKCAGPCRLPYTAICNGERQGSAKTEQYPLSLKDMYTLRYIPQLIQAGIDSFKIEGRMKSPEYVAGVTSIYRKYIDQYYANPQADIKVSKEDEKAIAGLYIRSDLQEGYYFKHNGKDMITLKGPGYAGTDDALVEKIKQQYVLPKAQQSVVAKAYIKEKEPIVFMVAKNREELERLEAGKDAIGFKMQGEFVQTAKKHSMTEEDFRKQFSKMGDTNFKIEELTLFIDGSVFIPIKFINEIRRNVIAGYENNLLKGTVRQYAHVVCDEERTSKASDQGQGRRWSCLVSGKEQLEASLEYATLTRIYVDSDLLLNHSDMNESYYNRVSLQHELYLVLPHILRKRSYSYLKEYERFLSWKREDGHFIFSGVLIRNVEELSWLSQIKYTGNIVGDTNLYAWNRESIHFWSRYMNGLTLPIELNKKEKKHVILKMKQEAVQAEEIVYGHIPMMYSANCTKKTYDLCDGKSGYDELIDRYKNHFPIYHNCRHCYNIIYNTVPTSLFSYRNTMENVAWLRLEFTNESRSEVTALLNSFLYDEVSDKQLAENEKGQPSYTTGHYKRGVE